MCYSRNCTFFSIFAGVGPVGAMELLQEFPGEGLEGLKKFKYENNFSPQLLCNVAFWCFLFCNRVPGVSLLIGEEMGLPGTS